METQENIKGVLEWKHRKILKVYWNGNTGKYKRSIGMENTGKYKRCIGMETQENIKGVLEWKHRKI